MNDRPSADLRELLLALADDELILGQRDSEWCGHAPILEEDIAFANLALDELGHAGLWYALLAELDGQDPDTYPDRLIYFRDAGAYRCAQLVELPNGDWAFAMMRQFLFDAAEHARLGVLAGSAYAPLADTAAKILNEERYHLRHTQAWVRRLSLGTDESHARMQTALDGLWPYCGQLLSISPDPERFVAAGYFPADPDELQRAWEASTIIFLQGCELNIPQELPRSIARQEHTPHLRTLLTEMQTLVRQEPEARW